MGESVKLKIKKSFDFFINVFSIFMLLLFSLFAVCCGTKFIPPFLVFSQDCPAVDFAIITKIRLPRILLSVLCGALLGGTGAMFQGFFRNPLADSSIIGISSGATFGAVIAGFLPFSALSFLNKSLALPSVSAGAFLGSLIAALCVFAFSKMAAENSSVVLLLSGTASGTFFSALASMLLLVREKELHSVFAWTLGSFNGKGWNEFFVFAIPSVIALVLIFFSYRHLDVLVCGEMSAKAFGLNYSFVRNYVLIAGALATSFAVCEGGIISFVGLIAPHFVRKVYGPRHKVLIFQSMIYGAVLRVIADTIARTVIAPSEIPVGIITSLIGVPFFLFSLTKMNGAKS